MTRYEDLRPPGSDWISRRFADLERQIRELRAERGLPASETRGGAFIFRDDDTPGDPRLALGNVHLDADGEVGTGDQDAYGVVGFGDASSISLFLRQGDRGLVYPEIPLPMHLAGDIAFVRAITSGSFEDCFEGGATLPAGEVLAVNVNVQCDPGTAGEIRLLETVTGQTTTALAIPTNANGLAVWEWLHPLSTSLHDDRVRDTTGEFKVQARRTAGAGAVLVFPPQQSQFASRFRLPLAATDGRPRLL